MRLAAKIKERENLTIVIITHEMHVIRRVCDEALWKVDV